MANERNQTTMATGTADAVEVTATFSGEATVRTEYLFAPGPYSREFSYDATFSADRTTVSLVPFPVIEIDTDSVAATITLTEGGEGSFDPATGVLRVPMTLHFEVKFDPEAAPEATDVEITLSTGEAASPSGALAVAGSPLNATTGEIAVVGASAFKGGFLDGTGCSIAFVGQFSPVP